MPTTTTTHINFRGEAREALDFYASVSGGETMIVTYDDLGNVQDPTDAGRVMWGQVQAEGGFHVMAYDVQAAKEYDPGTNPFYVSLRGERPEDVTTLYEGLSDGAREILQPLGPAPWSPLYGMLTDRFGVTWVIDVMPETHG